MDPADGGDAHAGAVRRPRVDLRTEVRRHPPARVQTRHGRPAVLAQPAAAGHSRRRRRDSGAARRHRDPRRRDHLGSVWRVPRIGHHLARRPGCAAPSPGGAPGAAGRAAARRAADARAGTEGRRAVGTGVPRRVGRGDRQAPRLAIRASPIATLAEDEVRADAGLRRRRLHRSAGRSDRPWRVAGRPPRERRLRIRGKGWHRLRHEAAAGAARPAERDRDAQAPVHEIRRTPAHPRALGQAGSRRPRRLHRVDRPPQASPLPAAERQAVITHPEKLLFPDDGITKGELASYYEMLAPVMLPHLRRRPITMERYPAGIGRKGFIQKDVSEGLPAWLERVAVPKNDGTVHHPLVTDTRSLLWITNQNCITPHVWTSRAPDLYHPDICVFDLDPAEDEKPGVLRAAALALRDLLEEIGLPSWVKTSGSKGFHIAVPLDRKSEMGDAARFAHAVGTLLVRRDPAHPTQEFPQTDRGGRILVD